MPNTVKTKTPNAAVFIYNYQDRLGSENLKIDPFSVDQIILNTVSLKSVSTQKSKSSPNGAFEFRLAPIKNWVTAITPGSWCVIIMSNDKIDDAAKYGGGRVDEKSFKMLGRIESVRAVITTNQTTGARESEYIVTGSDWGVIFNSKFYVDPINRQPNDTALGMAERFLYDEYLLNNAGGFDIKELGSKPDPDYVRRAQDNDEVKANRQEQNAFFKSFSKKNQVTPPLKLDALKGEQKSIDSKSGLPTSRINVNFLLKFWGQSDTQTANLESETGSKLLGKSKQQFRIPKQLAKYMQFKDKSESESPLIGQMIQQISGTLESQDKYTNKDNSAGIIDFNTILGEHTMWQIISNNVNSLTNELVPEIRFENGLPKLTLYNRVRPFCINLLPKVQEGNEKLEDGESKRGDIVKLYYSKYKHVKKIQIDSDDVIACNYGTNWRDRLNFIEVNIARSLFQEAFSSDIKLESQIRDEDSIGRDGLQSWIASTQYIPINSQKDLEPLAVFAYKNLLKEWYFNTHKMFNGTLTLIGQDQYIQVGDNVMVDSKVINMENSNNNAKQKAERDRTFMLAHVESIQHQTVVDQNGGRVFTTTIDFVRGIITDVNGNLIVTDDIPGAVDQDAEKVQPIDEKNKQTFATSGPLDPDRQKLRGS